MPLKTLSKLTSPKSRMSTIINVSGEGCQGNGRDIPDCTGLLSMLIKNIGLGLFH